jgi:hypothetical protein
MDGWSESKVERLSGVGKKNGLIEGEMGRRKNE